MSDTSEEKDPTHTYHRFLDEAGDTTFYGKGKRQVIGQEGVSNCFILGMLKINESLEDVRRKVVELQTEIANEPYFAGIPSIEKAKQSTGYYLHAKNDIPEVRKMAFGLIRSIDCSFEAVVARKIYSIYENTHEGKEAYFYADLLSHLLKNKFQKYDRLVLNMAERSRCTTHANLNKGLGKAQERWERKNPSKVHSCKVGFNVQQPTREPLLNIADYFCWAIQRVFERGELRHYNYIQDQYSVICDVYDSDRYSGSQNYYGKKRRLGIENCLSLEHKKSP